MFGFPKHIEQRARRKANVAMALTIVVVFMAIIIF